MALDGVAVKAGFPFLADVPPADVSDGSALGWIGVQPANAIVTQVNRIRTVFMDVPRRISRFPPFPSRHPAS